MKYIVTAIAGLLLSSTLLAHAVGESAGIRFVFGSSPEPAITDELLSLVWMASVAESGDPAEHLRDLSVTLEMDGKTWGPFEPEAEYGNPSVFSTAHLFANPGEYMATLTFKLDGSMETHTIQLAAHIIDRASILVD